MALTSLPFSLPLSLLPFFLPLPFPLSFLRGAKWSEAGTRRQPPRKASEAGSREGHLEGLEVSEEEEEVEAEEQREVV